MRAPPRISLRRLRSANWLLLLFALLMVLPACAKKSSGTMAPGMGGMGGGGDYGGEMDMDEEGYAVDGMNMSDESVAFGDAMGDDSADYKFKKSGKMAREVMAQPAQAPADTRSEPEPPPPPPDGETPAPESHGRQIVYTAQMRVGVYNVMESMKAVEALPEKYGGWVHQRVEGRVVMKVPAKNLKKAMAEVSKLGNVEARNLQASDVTAEYTDLQSRIKVLQETQTQLLGLLKKAKTVEEALHVRNALDNVTMQLEVALGRMRQLQNMISFSTLTVELVERGPNTPTPSSNDPFPWVDSLGIEAAEWR